MIWNEYDKVAFIGFYLLLPEYRGRGIGSVIWDRAIARIPKHYTIALRSGPFPTVWRWNSSDSSENLTLLSVTVPVMVTRYKSKTTPIEGPIQHAYELDWSTLSRISESYSSKVIHVLVADE